MSVTSEIRADIRTEYLRSAGQSRNSNIFQPSSSHIKILGTRSVAYP